MGKNSWRRTLVIIVYPTITFVTGAVLGTVAQDLIERQVLSQVSGILALICVYLFLIGLMLYAVWRAVEAIQPDPVATVTFYELEPDRNEEADLYDTARSFVRSAKRSIWATSSLGNSRWSPNPDAHSEHERYFKSLIQRTEGRHPVPYQRVLQLDDGQSIPSHAGSDEFRQHLREMVQRRDKQANEHIGLSKTLSRRTGTLVVIDDDHLLWEIDERTTRQQGIFDSVSMQVGMRGFLVIHDPKGDAIRPFKTFVERLSRNSTRLDANDLSADD